ncbi:VOC family protein [Octadecabacter sp. CECT 8868]|uniref:VOC family protein n=1 Tax=Octadecabacter algicola TaxID=2909342 RepID=UPI001F2CCA4E|nr:VOC family protein [Octadecabacter algicola]MCF2904895.1 VOC family protein [Octadecabacter algicola]
MTYQPMTAWVEIPVTDLEKSMAYYDEVFGWTSQMVTDMGPNPIAILDGADNGGGGHLYPGKPPATGTGATLHLSVSGKLEDAAARVTKAGGEVLGPIVDIPAGRFQYTLDLDGNSIGLFELGKK